MKIGFEELLSLVMERYPRAKGGDLPPDIELTIDFGTGKTPVSQVVFDVAFPADTKAPSGSAREVQVEIDPAGDVVSIAIT